jgi:3-oxoacyl-[acyl-carrier protein] reductase
MVSPPREQATDTDLSTALSRRSRLKVRSPRLQSTASVGVTVNAVAPGFIRTAMTDAMTDEARTTLESRIALRRLGTPDDVAYAVAFLASEQAAYITGTVMNVSGGLYT